MASRELSRRSKICHHHEPHRARFVRVGMDNVERPRRREIDERGGEDRTECFGNEADRGRGHVWV